MHVKSGNIPFELVKDQIKNLLRQVEEYLTVQNHEYIALISSHETDHIEIKTVESRSLEGSEISIFPWSDIELPKHILVEAKYPDSAGKTPLGGPY